MINFTSVYDYIDPAYSLYFNMSESVIERLESVELVGKYPDLDHICFDFTKIRECDLSGAATPKLKKIWISFSLLESFRFPKSLRSIQ